MLTVVLPADLISILVTGTTIADPPDPVVVAVQIGLLLPGVGFIVGLLSRAGELIDRLLAVWLAALVSAAALGLLYVSALALTRSWLTEPWDAALTAAVVVVAGIRLIPFAQRLA